MGKKHHKRKLKKDILSWKEVKNSKLFKSLIGNSDKTQSINNIVSNNQIKLIQMSDIIAEYDYKMEKLNTWAVSFNPEFKMKHTMNFGKLYTNKISDLSILKAKWKNGEISFNKYKEQINNKKLEIASYEKELMQLKGDDNFKSSFINNAINTLNENIWYKYFSTETGEPLSNGVMYKDLDKEERKKVLIYIYNTTDFYQKEFTEDDFIKRAIDVSEEFDEKDE